jgi:group I intron endonuclease
MSGCIYLIQNTLNNKCYIGQSVNVDPIKRYNVHWITALNGSSYILHRAMRKHGKEHFKVEYLCIVPHEALNRMEAYYAEQYESYIWDNPGGYNMIWCGGALIARIGFKMPKNVKEALRNSRIGSKHTEESKQKMSNALKGRKLNEESIRKSALSRFGRKLSDETKEKISQKAKERGFTEQMKINLSKGRYGHPHSEETRKKMSERMKGYIFSEEIKEKISKTKLSQNLKNKNKLNHGSSILSEIDCNTIRSLKGIISYDNLAKEYNVSKSHIKHIQDFQNQDFNSEVRVP